MGWVSFVNAPIVPAGPGGLLDTDAAALSLNDLDEEIGGSTPKIAPLQPDGALVVVGSSQVISIVQGAWLLLISAAFIANNVNSTSPNATAAVCTGASAAGWEMASNMNSGSIFHEHAHLFIGEFFGYV